VAKRPCSSNCFNGGLIPVLNCNRLLTIAKQLHIYLSFSDVFNTFYRKPLELEFSSECYGRPLSENKSLLTSSAISALALVTAPGSRPRKHGAPFLDSALKRLLKSLRKLSEKGLRRYKDNSILVMQQEHLDDILPISEPLGLTLWIQPILRDDISSQKPHFIFFFNFENTKTLILPLAFDMPGIYQGPSSAIS